MTEIPNGRTASARIVREFMLRAGLDEHSAAHELEIDEETMQGYASGEAVPMRIVLALMMLADMETWLRHN